jgi:hypothetical protein
MLFKLSKYKGRIGEGMWRFKLSELFEWGE